MDKLNLTSTFVNAEIFRHNSHIKQISWLLAKSNLTCLEFWPQYQYIIETNNANKSSGGWNVLSFYPFIDHYFQSLEVYSLTGLVFGVALFITFGFIQVSFYLIIFIFSFCILATHVITAQKMLSYFKYRALVFGMFYRPNNISSNNISLKHSMSKQSRHGKVTVRGLNI